MKTSCYNHKFHFAGSQPLCKHLTIKKGHVSIWTNIGQPCIPSLETILPVPMHTGQGPTPQIP